MAPIQIPVQDTLETLRNVLKRRTEAHQALKEREVLSGGDYRQLEDECDKTEYIQELDADNTKASIYYTRRKWTRWGPGRKLHAEKCTKGKMMGFLRWICETYIVPKSKRGKRGKRKSVNQYWRDFKMLYRRANGTFVNANDSLEVVKYINGELKVDYDLDKMPKAKPLAGVDTLLLLLTQHWARDKSVFRTEDDRLDFATVTLFLAYTGGRPAEFVHVSKNAASQDPLGKEEEAPQHRDSQPSMYLDQAANDDCSDDDDSKAADEIPDEDIFDNDSSLSYDDVDPSDSDEEYGETIPENPTDGRSHPDSGYSSDRDRFITESEAESYVMEVDEGSNPAPPSLKNAPLAGFEERRMWKALCYKDICLWIVQNPKRGARDLLAMEVCLRHHKGADKKPKPTIFLFRENALPIFCPITHILARVIRDDAVLVDGYTSAEPFFNTNLRRMGNKAMRVNWKPEWLKRPLFRQSVHEAGVWAKSKTEPMTYSLYNFYLQRCGRDAGLENVITSYCFRRAAINAANGLASDAVRRQIARHNPAGGVFNGSYLNEIVKFNSQDAYLESDVSEDGLTRAFGHISLRYHPGAPSGVPAELLRQLLAADPEIASLGREFNELYDQIKATYRFINHAPEEKMREHKHLQQRLKNAKKSLTDELNAAYRRDYFFRVHNEIMKMSLDHTTIEEPGDEPMVQHELEERIQLQVVLCNFSRDLPPQEIVSRKVTTITLFVALASRRVCQTRQPRRPSADSKDPIKQEYPSLAPPPLPQPDPFPLVCKKTQYIICPLDTRLTDEERTRKFARASNMMTHVEGLHLAKLQPGEKPVCQYPQCSPGGSGLFFDTIMQFKSHVGWIHKIKLREFV